MYEEDAAGRADISSDDHVVDLLGLLLLLFLFRHFLLLLNGLRDLVIPGPQGHPGFPRPPQHNGVGTENSPRIFRADRKPEEKLQQILLAEYEKTLATTDQPTT